MIRTVFDRASRAAATLLAGLGIAGSAADAKPIAPDQAPPAWVAYAESATATLSGWLNADDPPAPRLRAALDPGAATADPRPLVVRLWIAPDGVLTRVEAAPGISPRAGQDLRDLLVGRHLPPPPRRMLQPLRLALRLQPPAPADVVLRDAGTSVETAYRRM